MADVALVAAAAAAGYLAGTFPTAVLVTRVTTRGRVDIRSVGSGNPGGLNTMLAVGRAWGIVVILVDIAKGAAGALLGWAIADDAGAYAAATAVILGHVFPVWSRFRGGKGVATSAGAVLVVFPTYFPIDALVALVGSVGTRNPERTVQVAAGVWVGAALAWWLADIDNLWGPDPSVGLFLSSLVSAGIILAKFRLSAIAAARSSDAVVA